MALRALNSIGGFSVGEIAANIILANGDITTENGTFTGNAAAGNVLTNNLLYANGTAWSFTAVAGSNTQVQFNNNGVLGASANFTFSSSLNILTVLGNIVSTNANLGNSATANFFTGVLTTASQPNITSVGTLTALDVTGNVSAANFVGALANGTSNVNIPAVNGNVNLTAAGNTTLVVTGTGANITGTINVSGNANIGAGNVVWDGTNFRVNTAKIQLGANAGLTSQGASAVAIGSAAGANTQGASAVAIGDNSGNVQQGGSAIAIGASAGLSLQGASAVAIGTAAGAGGANGQGNSAVAVGPGAGNYDQGNRAVAIGRYSGYNTQGSNAIAIGAFAGRVSQGANSIIINATGANLNQTVADTFTVKPVRLGNTAQLMYYNSGTGEITYDTPAAINTSSISNGTSNVNIPAVNGNVTISSAGSANIVVVTGTGANITGTLNVSNTTTSGNFATAGNLTASFLVSNVTTGTAPIIVNSTTRVANLNVNYANVADFGVVTAQTTGTFFPTFVSGSSTGNYAQAANSNLSFNAATGALSATLFTGTLTTASQPNVTSVGTLTALDVTGNISAGNVSATTFTGALTGNASGSAATVTTAAQPNITSVGTLTSLTVSGNISAGNVSGTLLTGTLTTAAQPNITSVGTLNDLSVTGNITTSANLITDLIVGKTTSVTITAVGSNQNINLIPTGIGTVNVGNFIISNVATPLASTDAATKQYVDDVAQGLHTHDSCQAATPTTLSTITSGTITYNNGASGVGANLVTTGSFNLIDGVNVQTSGTRILVKDEANAAHNGIYVWSNATVITRADDFNTPAEMAGGDFTFVAAGTVYDNTGWVMTDPVTTVGTSPVVWVQFSGAGTYQAGTGLALNGSVFSIANTTVTAGSYGNGDYNATFTVNGQGQLSAAANVAITANAANLTGTLLNAAVVTSSLTSVGTLGSLVVTGTTTSGNFATAGNLTASFVVSNVATGTAPIAVASTTRVANLNVDYANVADFGVVTTQSSGTYYPVFVNGNTTANYAHASNSGLSANLANGALIATTFVGALSGAATTAGTVTTAAQPNITSVGTLTALGVSGTITAANITANTGVFTGNGNGLSSIVGANVTGTVANATYAVSAGSATTAATVTTNAQPNITSVGTLTGLVVGNATANTTFGNGTITALGNLSAANISTAGNLSSNNATVSNLLSIGNTGVSWNTITTTGTSANQTLATFAVSNSTFTGVEFIVKSTDVSGSKFAIATVQAVTDGATTDYATFATVRLGTSTGTLSVNITSGPNLAIQVTPASSNSTVWTTQYRFL